MQKMNRTLVGRPLWIITCYQNTRINMLTIDPDSNGGFLAIFSFKEEAEMFISLLDDDEKDGWHSKQTSAGELVSLLLGPCAGVRRVALDPLPFLFARETLPLLSVDKERFLQELMGEGRELARETVPA
jgi:hypothetical protein